MAESDLSSEVNATTVLPSPSGVSASSTSNGDVDLSWTNNDDSPDGGIDVERATKDYNKQKSLDVTSVSGAPTIRRALPIKITSGDDSTTGPGEIVLDWSNISSKSDIAVYDENDNLLDYWIESFDATAETAVLHVYRDWVRDGSTQAKIAYGDAPSDQSVSSATVFDKESDLQAGWGLNEDSGDALDLTSNNNDGTVNGATQNVDGRIGGAYDFDGSDDHVRVPYDSSIDLGSADFTISFWIDGTPNPDFRYIISTYQGRFPSWYITTESNTIFSIFEDSGGNEFRINDATVNVEDGNWHFIVLTRNGDTVTAYVDVSQDDQVTNSAVGDVTQANDLTIVSRGGASLFREGKVDDIRIHSAALSSTTITAQYDAAKATPDFFSQQSATGATISGTFSDVATGLSPSATSYTDTTVSSGETYEYRVERNTDHATAASNTTDITT